MDRDNSTTTFPYARMQEVAKQQHLSHLAMAATLLCPLPALHASPVLWRSPTERPPRLPTISPMLPLPA
jgi:hypothetical protein